MQTVPTVRAGYGRFRSSFRGSASLVQLHFAEFSGSAKLGELVSPIGIAYDGGEGE
jgi:hypothetical protein